MSVVMARRELNALSDDQLREVLAVNRAFEIGIATSPGYVKGKALTPAAVRAWLTSQRRSGDALLRTIELFAHFCLDDDSATTDSFGVDSDPEESLPTGDGRREWLRSVAKRHGHAAAMVCLIASIEEGDLGEDEIARLRMLIAAAEVGRDARNDPEESHEVGPSTGETAPEPENPATAPRGTATLTSDAATEGSQQPARPGPAETIANALKSVERHLSLAYEAAGRLSSTLEQAAEEVRSTGWPPESMETELSAYRFTAESLRQALEQLLGQDPGAVNLPDYKDLLSAAVERHREDSRLESRAVEIRSNIAELRERLDSETVDFVRGVYRRSLAELEEELSDVLASDSRSETVPPTPAKRGRAASPAIEPATPQDGETRDAPSDHRSVSRPGDGMESALGEQAEPALPEVGTADQTQQRIDAPHVPPDAPVGQGPTQSASESATAASAGRAMAPEKAQPGEQAEGSGGRAEARSEQPKPEFAEDLAEDVAALVRGRRPAAAAIVAGAVPGSSPTYSALRFYAAAFASRDVGGLSPDEALLAAGDVPELLLPRDHVAAVAYVTAAARAGLAAGWGYPALHEVLLRQLTLDEAWHTLLEATAQAVQHGYTHREGRTDSQAPDREGFAELATGTLQQLESRTIVYQRGTKVLRRLLLSDQPVGSALGALKRWAEGDDGALADVRDGIRRLQDRRGRDRLIDDADRAVSSAGQRKKKIIAAALNQLHTHLTEVHDLLSAALRTARMNRSGDADREETHRQLVSRASAISDPCTAGAVEAALLENLRLWILEPDLPWKESGSDLDDLMWRASIPLIEAPRDEQGQVDLSGLAAADVAGTLATPPVLAEAVRKYLDRGDLATASSVAEGDAALLDLIADAEPAIRASLHRRVLELEQSLAGARAQGRVDEEEVTQLSGLLAGARAYLGERVDLQLARLGEVQAALDLARARSVEAFLAELDGLVGTDSDRQRIRALAEGGDLATAREYQLMLERGDALPGEGQDASTLLEQFVKVTSRLPHDATIEQIVDASGGLGEGPRAALGIEAWTDLHADNRSTEAWRSVRGILRLLGLDLDDSPKAVEERPGQRRSGFWTYRVSATPVDGSIVPALGSRAHGTYQVVHVTERKAPDLVLQTLDGDDSQTPSIVVLKWLLSERDRRAILDAARRRRLNALVVDRAVVGFLAARHPGSFLALQRIALPFSTFRYYTPYVAGDVPSEAFVGRLEQKHDITNPDGSLFVYGGRQLGKTALLRRIEGEFTDEPERHAIYLDLKAKGIGTTRPSEYLWAVLAEEFHRRGIIRGGIERPETVVARVVEWLRDNPSRRIILLLDEADAFLESEARPPTRDSVAAQFANVGLLKDLMQQTSRRFKPVFAGLHQVQRFHHISNTPLAHGGHDILVGPLSQSEALDLVERPLAALGFRFENRDLVWRLLAATNYQASLIQIACHHLIEALEGQRPRPNQPPTFITSADVDRVLESREVRQRLVERFRWTIGLEHRYLVIALVLGVLGYDEGFAVGHDPDEILSWCRDFWPAGFGDMTSHDFALYLDEMQGLGVLRERADGTWTFRSPNVVGMLGSRDKLERELSEGEKRFELPFDFNPRVARREVRTGRGRVRSPLSEADLSRVFPGSMKPGVIAVFGSKALGIDSVPDVLHVVGREAVQALGTSSDVPLEVVDADAFGSFARPTTGGRDRSKAPRLAVVDALGADQAAVGDLIDRLTGYLDENPRWRGVLVLGQSAVAVLARTKGLETVRLRRWTGDDLRAWSEGVFDDPDARSHTLTATGGWPRLVERVLKESAAGRALPDVIAEIEEFPSDAGQAKRFLAGVAPAHLLPALRAWAQVTLPAEEIDMLTLQEVVGMEPGSWPGGDVNDLVTAVAWLELTGESDGELALNPVVHRALQRLGQ